MNNLKFNKNTFYLTSSHGGCGSSVMFHALDGRGYTTNIKNAHIFTFEYILNAAKNGEYNEQSIPLLCKLVDELSVIRVDSQNINQDDHFPNSIDNSDEYYAIYDNKFDGNDFHFISNENIHPSTLDPKKALILSKNSIEIYLSRNLYKCFFVSKKIIDNNTRSTFKTSDINRNDMIKSAGITGIRKLKPKNPSGKFRVNCTKCGRINWQYNPYELEECSNKNH